jgi:hypothetical protein
MKLEGGEGGHNQLVQTSTAKMQRRNTILFLQTNRKKKTWLEQK